MTTPRAAAAVTATFAEIAALANELCDHLADEPFATAAHIRALAETSMATNGEH